MRSLGIGSGSGHALTVNSRSAIRIAADDANLPRERTQQEKLRVPGSTDLAQRADFQLGDLRISPARRRVCGPAGVRHIEPQFMVVFLRLLQSAGRVVTRRELFDECWGGVPVGDDSLNRAVAGARHIAAAVGSSAFTVETIPRTGYMLKFAPAVQMAPSDRLLAPAELDLQTAIEDAFDCWRLGLPKPDHQALGTLKSALSQNPGDGRAWGIFALLLRKAAEYGEPHECATFVQQCEQAARRALALVAGQSDARVAITGIVPIMGNWSAARSELAAIRADDPDHVPAAHDMAVLEMATGRPSAARPIIEELIARDPLGATYYYKRMYHLWTFGDRPELDRIAARGLQLWPGHPAIWSARLWTLVFTERAAQALRFLDDETCRPPITALAADLLRMTCTVAAAAQSGEKVDANMRGKAVSLAFAAAGRGPAQAVAALMALCAMDAIAEAFEVAGGYYLARGRAITPSRSSADDPSITDQHRRVTQPLFIPSARRMREDPRFLTLCQELGLSAYWERFGLTPDFLDRAT